MIIKLLCIGDIVGRPGRQVLADHLHQIVKEHDIDCVIANAENVSGGSGLTPQAYDKLLKYGIDVMTLGDHVFRKRDIIATLNNSTNIVRPANLSPKAAGKDWVVYTTNKGPQVAVVCLLGRMFMSLPSDNPFNTIERILSRIPNDIKTIIVDMHAEASSEKVAMGWFLDGRVSCVFGTHTHVASADERVLPKGTAYISDLGMTGPHESVLGRDIEPVLKSLITQMPYMYSVATNDIRMNGVIISVDGNTGRAQSIERICVQHDGAPQKNYDADDGKPSPHSNGAP